MGMNVTIFFVEPPREALGQDSRWGCCCCMGAAGRWRWVQLGAGIWMQPGAGGKAPVSAAAMQVKEVAPLSRCRPPARRSAATANWLKLRAFGLTQYDAVLLVDSNAYIGGDISPLFNLPTDFAAGWDQVRGWGWRWWAVQAVGVCAACAL